MVEKQVEMAVEEEYYSVSGKYYSICLKRELSENFLEFHRDDTSIVYDILGEQPFGKLHVVKEIYEERGSGGEDLKFNQVCL